GKTAFQCTTSVETMSAILRADPPELPETVPPPIRQLVRHCLEKEPDRRFQSAKDLAFQLHSYASGAISTVASTPALKAPRPRPWGAIAAAALGVLAAYAIAVLLTRPLGADLSSYRFTPFATESEVQTDASWSPDGKNVAYQRVSATGPNT